MAIATAMAWGCAGTAQATGWYHMPSNCFQYMGWGFGPGYHAPLVLGPHGFAPTRQQERIRLQCAPFAVGVGCDACTGCQTYPNGTVDLPYASQGSQMPTDYPLLESQQPQGRPAAAPVQWRMPGPPASAAVGR